MEDIKNKPKCRALCVGTVESTHIQEICTYSGKATSAMITKLAEHFLELFFFFFPLPRAIAVLFSREEASLERRPHSQKVLSDQHLWNRYGLEKRLIKVLSSLQTMKERVGIRESLLLLPSLPQKASFGYNRRTEKARSFSWPIPVRVLYQAKIRQKAITTF